MNVEDFREYCLSLPGARENFPWTDPKSQNLMTFTVGGKWFCLLDLDNKFCNIKCAPDLVAPLQDEYEGIIPAWHMNKKHWITLKLDSDVLAPKVRELVRRAYDLIVAALPKATRLELNL